MSLSASKPYDIVGLPHRNLLHLKGSSDPPPHTAFEGHLHHTSEESVSIRMFPELFRDGKQRAIASGALTSTPAELEPLVEHAKSMARQARREPFDPETDPADQLRLAEFERTLAGRLEVELATRNLAISLQEAEEWRSNHCLQCSRPSLRWYVLGGALAIALTIAVALHDLVFMFPDEVTAWVCSFLIGIICGGVVTAFLVTNDNESPAGSKPSHKGLIAGIIFGVALFALRMAATQTVGGLIFAGGMTLLEIAIVIGLHHVAKHHWSHWQKFRDEEKELKKAQSHCEVLQANLTDHQQQLQQHEVKIQDHIRYVSERQMRHQHADKLEELAIAAVRDGYAAGVAENVGRRRNVKIKKGGEQ